jgi:MFS family permease
MDAAHLGFLFTSMAIGSLVGAVYLLPWLRRRANPNGATLWAGGLLAGVFLLMAWVRQPVAFVGVTALAGVAWTVSASELWVAAQQATPAWARGRLNAAFMMTGQGAMALGGLLWGVAVTGLGAQATLLLAALAAGVGWALAARLSINFASRLRLEADPYSEDLHEAMHRRPSPQEGPVTVSVEYRIPVGSRERFLALMEEIRKGLLRNGALSFRLNENLERPEVYRLDLLASSWADHERQHRRMTQDEKARWQEAWALHGGPGSPQATHSVATKPGAWAKPTDQPARPSTLAFASRIPPAIE